MYNERPHPDSLPSAGEQGNGHRARLLERYIRGGIVSLNNYEILELLLTFVIPRRDTKPLAKNLLARYGTVSAAINAPFDELCEFDGLGPRSAALFPLIKDTLSYCLNERSIKKSAINGRKDMENYLRHHFAHRRDEYMAAVFLDSADCVITTEIVAHGTVNRCIIYPRQIIDRALKCGAAAFILAHNHPAGTADPSEGDWLTTEKLFAAGKYMDVPLKDHMIILKDCIISLKDYDRWPGYG